MIARGGQVRLAMDAFDLLGESPVWDAKRQALFWVDIKYPRLRQWAPASGLHRSWSVPSEVGSFALRRSGGAILATRVGFATLAFDDGAVSPLGDPEPEIPGNRFNDGKCDPRGRFWAGTMNEADEDTSGALYMLDVDLRYRRVIGHVTTSNGLGWSPDGTLMYYTDSPTHRIDVLDFDADNGTVSNRRLFADVPMDWGVPDGLTVDAEGCVWSACWDGWRVVRYSPDGSVEREIPVPVPRPTSCVFGGPDLSRLYVTSARFGLSAALLDAAPLSGAVLELDTDTRGVPEHQFAG